MKLTIKKKKIFFSAFGSFFDHFWSLVCPEKMIRKCFGGKEKE